MAENIFQWRFISRAIIKKYAVLEQETLLEIIHLI